MLNAGYYLGLLPPCLKAFVQGKESAKNIFEVLIREPLIKSVENPIKIDNFKGELTFENVSFSYPSRKKE